MAEATVGNVPFNEAIEYYKAKLKIPTEHWDDMLGEANAKGFTVAGATKADLLADFNADIESALKNGTTITEFRKQFDKRVAEHGWSYKGKRGWRTRVMYDTNMRTAHMAGKWQQYQRLKSSRPYLQYLTVGDERVRPEHGAWNGTILHIDDAWWSTHYPPNGWGCRCTARTLSQRQIDRDNLKVSRQAPPIKTTERINPTSGEIYGEVPEGIDVGWDYNVGKASLGPDIAFGEKIMAMPSPLRTAALNNAKDLAPHLEDVFSPWTDKLINRKRPLGEMKTIGYLSPKIVDELIQLKQPPTTAVITTTDKDIMHMLRDAKDGKHIPVDMVKILPNIIQTPKAVLWDKRDAGLLYIFDVLGEERDGKFVIRVNYKTKARTTNGGRHSVQTNTLRTGGLVLLQNLKDDNFYEVIEGEL